MFHNAASWLRGAGWKEWHVLQIKSDLPVRSDNGMLWWIFRGAEDKPSVIGKFCDDPAAMESARRECRILEFLAPLGPELGIPELLFRHHGAHYFLHLQTIMPGTRLRGNLPLQDGATLVAQMALIEPWLERFQKRAPASGSVADAAENLRVMASGFADPVLLAAIGQAAPELGCLPAVAVHGDFWAHNLLASRGHLSVVDWSTYHEGAFLEDLFTFSTSAVYHQDRSVDESVELFWQVLFGTSPHAACAGASAHRTLAGRQVGHELLGPFFMMFLIRRLLNVQFLDNEAWKQFARRYIASGMPSPWSSVSSAMAAAGRI